MAVNYRINDAIAPGTVAVLDAEDKAHFVGNRDQAQQWLQANLSHAAPTHPMPGDAVRLDGPYYGAKPGAIAIIDSTYYGMDDEVMFVFRPSAFRGPSSRMAVLEDCGVTRTPARYRLPIGRDHVSVSGGPCPFANVADLEYVGLHTADFWRWKLGISGAGRDERYTLDVPLWSWKGKREDS